MTSFVRSSTHSISTTNIGKYIDYKQFIADCRSFASLVLDDIWTNGYTDGNYHFNIATNSYNLPSLPKDKFKHIDSPLTARARKCIINQVSGMIRAETAKQQKRLYVFNKAKEEGITKHQLRNLIKAIKQNIPQKPNISKMNLEIDAICNELHLTPNGKFYGFIRLKSIYKSKKEIKIPVVSHRHLQKMTNTSDRRLNSILLTDTNLQIRWQFDKPIKEKGNKLGCDQGLKTILSATDSSGKTQTTPNSCPHGHTMDTILDKLARKKKGSKAFKRAELHRKNFIHYMVNQIDLDGINDVRFEEIINITKGRNVSRKMKHWTNTIIRDKMKLKCEDEGVRFTLQSCTYRSQRCSCCGLVRKANRKGKIYTCKGCGYVDDSDINASRNHIIDLPDIPYNLRKARHNLGSGFYWNHDGFYDLLGGHLQFPFPDKK